MDTDPLFHPEFLDPRPESFGASRRPTNFSPRGLRRASANFVSRIVAGAGIALVLSATFGFAIEQKTAFASAVRLTRASEEHPPERDLEVSRAAFQASLNRLRAKGLDADAIAKQAATNLQHWRENPAEWDRMIDIKLDEG